MLVLLMSSLPIKSATVNYCNYEGELPSNPSFDAAREVALLQWPLESAPLVSWQPPGCRVRPAHDSGDVGGIVRFILDNWASQSRLMSTIPFEIIKHCAKSVLGLISFSSLHFLPATLFAGDSTL